MKQKTNRWAVLAAGLVAMLLVGLLYAWSLFRPYLSEMFPSWSATDLSMVFTVSMITFSLSMFVCGKLQIKCGCKVTLLITAVLMGVGFFGASSLDPADPSGSLARLVVFYGVLCGASVGFGYNTALTIVPFWFPKNFGLIVGTLMMAFGISSLVLGGATEGFISAFGLNAAFRMLAILACALLVLATLFIKKAPDEMYAAAASKDAASGGGRDYTTLEMLATATFWLCMLASVVRAAGGLSVINSAATIALSYGLPAMVGMLVSLFNAIGRISAGAIHDRFGYRVGLLANAFTGLTAAACLILGNVTQVSVIILCGFAFAGLAYGGANPVLMAFMKEAFGSKYYAVNVGIAGLSVLPASILGPLLTGALQDAAPAGDPYGTTFLAMLALYGMNTVFTFMYLGAMRNMKRRQAQLQEREHQA